VNTTLFCPLSNSTLNRMFLSKSTHYVRRYSQTSTRILSASSSNNTLKNVSKAMWSQKMSFSSVVLENGWEKKANSLTKIYHFKNYTDALEAARKVNEISDIMNYYANMNFTHNRDSGVKLKMEYKAKKLTKKDYDATEAVDMLLGKDKIEMKKYTYNLNEESIAKYPASPRGSSKLMKCDSSGIVTYYDNFSESFPSIAKGCHIVFNDSRVLEARLFIYDGEEKIEMMILDLGSVDVKAKCNDTLLQVMIRSTKIELGDKFKVSESNSVEVFEVIGPWLEDEKSDGNGTECHVSIKSDQSVEEFLNDLGTVPIPPYLHRSSESTDTESYNNIYAANAGSVAAPTAGLHFTDDVLNQIGPENCSYLSLHVGAGTFKPVMVTDARDHEMHAEVFNVSVWELKSIIAALKEKKPLIVVGTTSSRTLETLFWCGLKKIRGLDYSDKNGNLLLGQFEWIPMSVSESFDGISRIEALEVLVDGLSDTDMIQGNTSLMISPPMYKFKVVDHLVTNFHAPDSTLMLLVSAFISDSSGSKITKVYEDAQDRDYRFLSYGDVCMFSKMDQN